MPHLAAVCLTTTFPLHIPPTSPSPPLITHSMPRPGSKAADKAAKRAAEAHRHSRPQGPVDLEELAARMEADLAVGGKRGGIQLPTVRLACSVWTQSLCLACSVWTQSLCLACSSMYRPGLKFR
jgi:hypothetical protein